jgi:hypothetical protein
MSHATASRAFGYQPRPFRESMADAIAFYKQQIQYDK